MTNVIIVDDQQMMVDALRSLLSDQPEISVVGEAANGIALLELLETQTADIILMDQQMPGMTGLEATGIVSKKYPGIKILVLTMHNKKKYVSEFIKAGASGYLVKNDGKEELLAAINAVQRGEKFLSEKVKERMVDNQLGHRPQTDGSPEQLTAREWEILELIASELSSQEIADKLNLTLNTIEYHRKQIISKLNLNGKIGIIKFASQHGIIDERMISNILSSQLVSPTSPPNTE